MIATLITCMMLAGAIAVGLFCLNLCFLGLCLLGSAIVTGWQYCGHLITQMREGK